MDSVCIYKRWQVSPFSTIFLPYVSLYSQLEIYHSFSTLIVLPAGFSGTGLVVWETVNFVLYGSVAVSYFLLFMIVKMHFSTGKKTETDSNVFSDSTNAARQFTRRILRSLCVTACCIVCGQLTTVSAASIASALGVTGVQMLRVLSIGGLAINISMACQFFIYYFCR